MKKKTTELTDAALDWAVAKCAHEGKLHTYGSPCFNPNTKRVYETECLQQIGVNFAPSTSWAQGGPIIEREAIELRVWDQEDSGNVTMWEAEDTPQGKWAQTGPTPLIAACRCYVASKLGDEVEIPEELT